MAKQPSHDMDSPYTPQLRDLIDRAQQGDETALPELRALLDETPDLWQQVGDVAKHVETSWIKLLSGGNLLTQESLHREAERRRIALLGGDPTPIELHLIETIVACWLQVKHAEMQMGNSLGATEKRLTFLHRRLDSAQKQHRAAIDQLVKINKEDKPARRTPGKSSQQPSHSQQSRKGVRHRVVAA